MDGEIQWLLTLLLSGAKYEIVCCTRDTLRLPVAKLKDTSIYQSNMDIMQLIS